MENISETQIDWMRSLKKGDKVWASISEPIARSDRFQVDLLEAVGPGEFESLEDILVPHEMTVRENIEISGSKDNGRVVTMGIPLRFCFLGDNDLTMMLSIGSGQNSLYLPMDYIFPSESACREFCTNSNVLIYSREQCDSILSELEKIKARVERVREKCFDLEC